MGRHALRPERRALLFGCGYVFGQEHGHRVAAECATGMGAWEQWIVGLTAPLLHPFAYDRSSRLGERRDAFLAAFAHAPDMGPNAEHDVLAPQPDELGHSEPCLQIEEQQSMVPTSPRRGAVWGGKQGVNLRVSQERDDRPLEALRGDSEHPLDERGVVGMAQRRETEQRMDGASRAFRVRTLLPRSVSR